MGPSAVITPRMPTVVISADARQTIDPKAAPLAARRQVRHALTGILESQDVGLAIFALANRVRRKMSNAAVIGPGETAPVGNRLANEVIGHGTSRRCGTRHFFELPCEPPRSADLLDSQLSR